MRGFSFSIGGKMSNINTTASDLILRIETLNKEAKQLAKDVLEFHSQQSKNQLSKSFIKMVIRPIAPLISTLTQVVVAHGFKESNGKSTSSD